MTVSELTRELVAIPSHADETAVGDFLTAWLRRETDATVRRDGVGNVFGRRGPTNEAAGKLALVGHHDVVPPADRQLEDDGSYTLSESEGRLFGRGTADMKGSLAAALLAFRDADPACELVFVSFVGEEDGGEGAQYAIEDGFAPDWAVVGEGSTGYSAPGVTDVAVAHKGRRGSTITADGRAAHASNPAAGENAIYRATDAIEFVRQLEAPTVEQAGDRLEGSLAVTEIEGGSAWNAVPERCTVTVDERTVPGERGPLEDVETLPGIEWTVDQDLPPMACHDEEFATAVLEAVAASQSSSPPPPSPAFVTKPHATDAGWLAQAGTACVVCGAAEPGEAHTATESVSLAVVERCRRIYQQVAERWPA